MKQETILEAAFNYATQRFPNGENKDVLQRLRDNQNG